MLTHLLNTVIQKGSLIVVKSDGSRLTFGAGSPTVIVRLHDRRALWELALHPDLKLGELYMDGRLTMEQGDIADLLKSKGVRAFQANNEALGVAAMNGSQMAPCRAIVAFKSVGTHVASDALALGNLAGAHPKGGAVVIGPSR